MTLTFEERLIRLGNELAKPLKINEVIFSRTVSSRYIDISETKQNDNFDAYFRKILKHIINYLR